MKFYIPFELIQVVGLWLAAGTLVQAVTLAKAAWWWHKQPEDKELLPGSTAQLPGGLTKDTFRQMLGHMLFQHGAHGLWLLVVVTLFLFWRIVIWPYMLWKMIRKEPPNDKGDGESERIPKDACPHQA